MPGSGIEQAAWQPRSMPWRWGGTDPCARLVGGWWAAVALRGRSAQPLPGGRRGACRRMREVLLRSCETLLHIRLPLILSRRSACWR